MKQYDVLVGKNIKKATAEEMEVLRKFVNIVERTKTVDSSDDLDKATVIHLKHKFKDKDDARRIIKIFKEYEINVDFVIVNPKAMKAYNDKLNQIDKTIGYVTRTDKRKVQYVIEKIHKCQLTKTIPVIATTLVEKELEKEGFDYGIIGTFSVRVNSTKKSIDRINNLKAIIKAENLTITSATRNTSIYIIK